MDAERKEQLVMGLLDSVGAVIKGSHVVYSSWRHGADYINKDALYMHTLETSRLCLDIARRFAIREDVAEVVVAPTVGGVILSQWIAHYLSSLTNTEVLAVYADKTDDGDAFHFRRGYDKVIHGKRALLVDDVMTTGGTVIKLVRATRRVGGIVRGVGVLCNCGRITRVELEDVPFLHSLCNPDFESWESEFCPQCKKGVPINTDVGRGREYMALRS